MNTNSAALVLGLLRSRRDRGRPAADRPPELTVLSLWQHLAVAVRKYPQVARLWSPVLAS